MAKMFYTLEETKAALGRNEEGIKQLTREGRLREFRDGPRLMFKADQVEQLKGEIGAGDAVSLAPSESGAPLSLAGDSRGGSSGGLSLGDSSAGTRAPGSGDTQFADIGLTGSLSGSVGGMPSPGKSGAPNASGSGVLNLGGSGSGSGLSSHGTRGGITVFDVDESQRVDPSAQTAINPNQQDQINLEGVGSGSGLLDLTRESDDTSLGAVFDELQPGQAAPGRRAAAGPAPVSMQHLGSEAGISAIDRTTTTRPSAPPIYVEAADPFASALGGAALAVTGILVFAGFILGAVLSGYRPEILDSLRLDGPDAKGMMYLAVAIGLTVILGIVGFVVGKMAK